jgi:hypothetical protein
MRPLLNSFSRITALLGLAVVLVLPQVAYSDVIDEDPSGLAMAGDLLIARPLLLATTIVGAAVFVVSSPFAAAGGNLGQTADTLVLGPAKATFVRCLGCTKSGYRKEVVNADEDE